jgi:tetratricopeptide (TPR) repeat protein
MKILMEHGERLFLTAVFEGAEHADMKGLLKRAVQSMEEEHGSILESWSGDMEEVAGIQEEVDTLTESKFFVKKNLEGVKLDNERVRISDKALESLKGLSKGSAIMVILEDLHWADESSLFVLKYIARNIGDENILLLGTFRPGESDLFQNALEGMMEEGSVEELALQKLGEDSVSRLADEIYPGHDFPATLIENLSGQCEGNPLFVKEMLWQMGQEGSIVRDGEKYLLVNEDYSIPDSVQEVVGKRLDNLHAGAMALAEYVSCIGREFDDNLALSYEYGKDASAALVTLKDHGIVHSKGNVMQFSHAIYRDYIYSSIGERWKRAYHKNLGEYLENTYTDRLDEVIFDLARHFSRTKEHKKCTDYCTRAGEKAEGSYAMEQALEFYKEALDSLSGLDRTYAHDRTLDILERIGDIQAIIGKYDEAIGNFQKAKDNSEDKETKARMLRKSSTILTNKGDFDRSREFLEEARGVLGGASPRELGRILLGDATTYLRKGEFDEAMELYKGALDTFTKAEDSNDEDLAAALNGIGNVHLTRGEMNDALEVLESSLKIYERVGNAKDIALVLGNVGAGYHGLGKLDDALEYFNQSLEKREKVGDVWGIAMAQNNIGVAYQDKGELDKALESLNHSLEIVEKVGNKVGISIALYNISGLYLSKGELDRALEITRLGLEIQEKIEDKVGLAYSLYNIGRIYNYMGEPDRAKQHYEDCLAMCLDIGDKQYAIHPLCSSAELELVEGDAQGALVQVEKALGIAVENGVKGEEGLCHRVLGTVHREMEDWDKASEELGKAKTILEEVGHKEELARTFYDYALLYKAKGENNKAKEHLEKALTMFEEIGMKLWAERVRKELDGL